MEELERRRRRALYRCHHRGTKEMDLILGGWSDAHLAGLSEDELALYEALLEENDQDLYAWVAGRDPVPARFAALIARITREAAAPSR